MKFMTNLISSLIMAGWIGAIAIFSIQNIQLVSLKFFNLQSIHLPVGVMLAFCVGIGIMLGSLIANSFSFSN